MKTTHYLLLSYFVFAAATASALTPTQHLAKGVVISIDQAAIVLALERPDKDLPTSFTIKEERTRFRIDGKNAAADRPPIGQAVRLYYKKELGEWVATEVSWSSPSPQKLKPR